MRALLPLVLLAGCAAAPPPIPAALPRPVAPTHDALIRRALDAIVLHEWSRAVWFLDAADGLKPNVPEAIKLRSLVEEGLRRLQADARLLPARAGGPPQRWWRAATPAAFPEEESPVLTVERLSELDGRWVTVNFPGIPLEEVAGFLHDVSCLGIDVADDVPPGLPVTLVGTRIPLSTALRELARQLDLCLIVRDGGVRFTAERRPRALGDELIELGEE